MSNTLTEREREVAREAVGLAYAAIVEAKTEWVREELVDALYPLSATVTADGLTYRIEKDQVQVTKAGGTDWRPLLDVSVLQAIAPLLPAP